MIRSNLRIAGVVVVTLILTTLFQPLAFLQALAQHAEPCQTFRETGKSICRPFLQYWQQHGGLPIFGYPISHPFEEPSALDGKTYTVQYFERAVFEAHPENKPPYDVLLSQLGRLRYQDKQGAGQGTGPGTGHWWQPAPGTSWQWQISETLRGP